MIRLPPTAYSKATVDPRSGFRTGKGVTSIIKTEVLTLQRADRDRDRVWHSEKHDSEKESSRKSTKEEPEQSLTEKRWRQIEKQGSSADYRKRPRVVGVTEAVGEEQLDDKDSWGEDDPNVMTDDGADASVTDKSLFNSSLLLRETVKYRMHGQFDNYYKISVLLKE